MSSVGGILQDQAAALAGILAMALLTAAIAWRSGARLGWLPLVAIVRATLQLAILAVLLHGILTVPWTVVFFLVLMLTTASWTSAGRVGELWHGRRTAVLGVLVGSGTTILTVLVLHLVAWEVRYVIAVAGIIIGNAMTAASLSGRLFLRAVRDHRDEVEGWFALGATPSQAHLEFGREAIRETLLPTMDQTRATGLVTLPGAFVGALFGGLDPVDAARFQLVVLAGVGLTMVLTALVVTRLAGRSPMLPPSILHRAEDLPR